MSATTISQCSVTLHDVNVKTTEKQIKKSIAKYIANGRILKVHLGNPFHKIGREVLRVFVTLDKPESVDELIRNRSNLKLHGELLKITRTIPKLYPLYNQCVTGLKIKLNQSENENLSNIRLDEWTLRKHFEHFGSIRYCRWTNKEQTEALFAFDDYDFVDRIILDDVSPTIKGINLTLQKCRTSEDFLSDTYPYVIYVTNLPVRVTSEEIARVFDVPVALIRLHPCFRSELTYIKDGRVSSQAWITNFHDEKIAQILAEKKTGTLIRTNRIQCKVIPEPIHDEELCEHFQKGQCQYTVETCYYKHLTCSEPDTCDDQYCWLGHTNKRTTVSLQRPKYRSEDASYRIKFSNLPANITHDDLMKILRLDSRSSRLLIIEPTDETSTSSKMAYLIRQSSENKLRQQIDYWQNISFTPLRTQKLQCQLEINQDFFEWNDSNDTIPSHTNSRSTSPVPSNQSARSNRSKPSVGFYPSAASTTSWRQPTSKKSHLPEQIQIPRSLPISRQNSIQNKSIRNTLRESLVLSKRQPPVDLPNQWHWTNQMTPDEEFYWLEDESDKKRTAIIKIYSLKTDRFARIRALNEKLALEQLTKLPSTPKLLNNNLNSSENEFWNIIKVIDGERLSDYVKNKQINLRKALELTQQLLQITKEIHRRNIIHRDIQPKNILIGTEQSKMVLIHFSSAYIDQNQLTNSNKQFNQQLGNQFYRMPQFERRDEDYIQSHQQSPTIDITAISAILFWLITGHQPKESKDIWGKPPHRVRDHPKLIEKKIFEVTGFKTEMKIQQHLQRHLMIIFDRTFAQPDQQWSLIELDYQIQLILALLQDQTTQINYFPSPNINENISMSLISLNDPFVYVVSLIHHLKHQFMIHYSQSIRWSNELEKTRWHTQDGIVQHKDLLIFTYQTKNLSIDIHWNIKILKEQQFSMDLKAKTNDKIDILLPLGLWTIDQQNNHFQDHTNYFEIELINLVNILYPSIGS